jgi:hypothetical protein
MGLGVTPNTGWSPSLGKVLDLTGNASLYGYSSGGTFSTMLGSNSYYDATNWRAKVTGTSSLIQLTAGNFALQMAPSASAGAALTYTAVLTNQGVGQTLALQGASSSAGIGIAFPATQTASSDANTLDDYEEGTWTPVLKFAGNNVGMTFNQQLGQYIKIGRQVTAWFLVQLSAKGSSTGNALISGAPFGSSNYGHGPLDLNSAMTGQTITGGYAIIAGADIYLRYNGTTAYTDFNNAIFTNSSLILGVVTYYI